MKKFSLRYRTIIFFLCLVSSITFAQQPYAPWAPLSSTASEDISIKRYKAPTKDEVGIPAYYNAYITSVSAPRTDTTKYKQEVLPFVILVTSDDPSSVISFYKNILTKDKGWNYNDEMKMFIMGNSFSEASTGFIPVVTIREITGETFDLANVDESFKQSLKTRIEIKYKPPKK